MKIFKILVSLLFVHCLASAEQKPLNVLFIAVDDLRLQTHFYGEQQMITPGMDRLAEQSTVFSRAYCSVPVCGASRASLMSGVRPTDTRFVNYYTRKDRDFPQEPSIAEWFKRNGYKTISNGKIYHFEDDDLGAWSEPPWMPDHKGIGWQCYLTEASRKMIEANRNADDPELVIGPATEAADVVDNEYPEGMVADKAIKDLERFAKSQEPFFLGVGFWKPHLPFNAPKKYWDMYNPEKLKLASNPFQPEGSPDAAMHAFGELRNMYGDTPDEGPVSDELARRLIHGYYACVSYTDAQIAKVLDALERTGLAENTIVVLWGDHGWHLGEHALWCKHACFDLTLNAPLLVKVPGIEGGVQTKALTEFIDIYPTLCELTELPLPNHLDGRSFASELANPDHYHKDYAYSRYHAGESIITNSYIYTEWRGKEQNIYGSMLYDHKSDPDENVNVVDLPQYEQVVNYMKSKLDEVNATVK